MKCDFTVLSPLRECTDFIVGGEYWELPTDNIDSASFVSFHKALQLVKHPYAHDGVATRHKSRTFAEQYDSPLLPIAPKAGHSI